MEMMDSDGQLCNYCTQTVAACLSTGKYFKSSDEW